MQARSKRQQNELVNEDCGLCMNHLPAEERGWLLSIPASCLTTMFMRVSRHHFSPMPFKGHGRIADCFSDPP